MMWRASPCTRHRPALLDLVDRGERGAGTDAALDHLAVCPTCERELTETAKAIWALRRVGSEVRAMPVPSVPSDAIARLATPDRTAWDWRFQLGGLIASAAIVAVLVAPRVGVLPFAPSAHSLMPDRPLAASWRLAEARIAASPDSPPVSAIGTLPPRYPEGLTRPWKEVFPTDATPREFEPS
jgi:hypothetical protein